MSDYEIEVILVPRINELEQKNAELKAERDRYREALVLIIRERGDVTGRAHEALREKSDD